MNPHKLPEGFMHLFQDRLYLESISYAPHYMVIGKEGNLGRRVIFGPFCVEYYTCDKEPELLPFKGLRFVIWTPVTRTDVPIRWFQPFKKSTREVCAYINIQNTDIYYTTWSKIFRNYYHHFSKQHEYKIESISWGVFCSLYKQYGRKSSVMLMALRQLQKLGDSNEKATCFYVLKNIVDNEIVAGIATVDCFSVNQSYYVAAFTRKEIAPNEAGLWLLNHWMKESSARGIAYANFGNIWTPGQPKSWKGFSEFKMKFNPQLIVLQKELIRCTFSLFG